MYLKAPRASSVVAPKRALSQIQCNCWRISYNPVESKVAWFRLTILLEYCDNFTLKKVNIAAWHQIFNFISGFLWFFVLFDQKLHHLKALIELRELHNLLCLFWCKHWQKKKSLMTTIGTLAKPVEFGMHLHVLRVVLRKSCWQISCWQISYWQISC